MKSYIKIISLIVTLFVVFSFSSCRPIEKDLEDETTEEIEETEETNPIETDAPPDTDFGSTDIVARKDGVIKILLDPGHGFKDVGCESVYGFIEKDITLILTKKLENKLVEMGAVVFLTHDGETFPSVSEIRSEADRLGIEYEDDQLLDNDNFSAYERSVWENIVDAKEHIDLFLSVHVNSIEGYPDFSEYSVDYYVGNPHAKMLSDLCEALKSDLESEFNKNVRIFRDSFDEAYKVNKYTNAPSILLETGYATNAEDARNFKDSAWQDRFTSAVARSIMKSLEE